VTGSARQRALLALVCSAQFLVVLDMTIVSVALPELQADLGLAGRDAHWVITAYAVAFGGFLLVGGRAADAFGRRRLLVTGGAAFTTASLVCGISPNALVLVLARGTQGVGGALLSTAGFGLLVATFEPGPRRTRAIATWASTGSLGAVSGFVAGGVLTEVLGWRSIFLAVVPVGAALVVTAPRVLPESRAVGVARVDVVGAAFATAGVAALAFVVSAGAALGWHAPLLLAAAAVAIASLLAFAMRERGAAQPLLPSRLLRERSFATAGLVGVAYGSTVLGTLMLLGLYLQRGRGLGALEAGALMVLLRVPAVGWARVAGRLVGRFGAQPFLVVGSALLTTGGLAFAQLPANGSLWNVVPGLILLGVAIPCLGVAVSTAALGAVPADEAGVASGLMTTFQWVGGSLGFAVVFALAGGTTVRPGVATQVVTDTVHRGFLACAVLGLVALAVSVAGLAGRPAPATCPG
jgi:EmrB/QacA subfamily drug resistance transporter